jgi:hypothetical protein
MFRFSIRELVLLTLVVAMGVGWWLDSRSKRRKEAAVYEVVVALENQVQAQELQVTAETARRLELQAELDLSKAENIRLRVERASSSPARRSAP